MDQRDDGRESSRGRGEDAGQPRERREADATERRPDPVRGRPHPPVPGEVPPRDRPPTEDTGAGPEVRGRASRLLDRAPGERFRAPEPEPPATSPSLARGALFALAGWVAVVLAWLVLAGIAGLDWGMLVIAAAGGWLVGTLASAGAWSGRPHLAGVSVRALAGGVAASAWLGGQAAVYLWTRVALPESGLELGARIAALPFPDYLSGVIGPLDAVELVLLAAVAWVVAR